MWNVFPRIHLVGWWLSLVFVTLGRWLMVIRYRNTAPSAEHINRWATLYTMGAFIAGIVWAISGFVMVTSHVLAYEVFSAFLLGGMAVGAITTSASWRPAYFAFMLPIAITVTPIFLTGDDKLHIVMGLLTLVFIWLLIRTANHLNKSLQRALVLRFKNSALVRDLTNSKEALEHTNRELQKAIIDQRQAREHLAESEHRFRTLAETTSAAIFVYRNRFEYANPAAEMISGYTTKEASSVPIAQLVHPDYRDIILERAKRLLNGEQLLTRYEVKILTKSNQERWLDVTAGVINYGGKTAILGTAIDITKHKQAEAALIHEKELAQVPLESIGEGVVTTNINAVVEYLNPVAEQLTGWKQNDAQGQALLTVLNLIDEVTQEPVENPALRCLHNGDRIKLSGHTSLVHRDSAHRVSVEVTTAPIRNHNSKIIGVTVIFHDITELRQLTQQMSFQASHDALTGLANRREFERILENALEVAHLDNVEHALCYMDLDQFKIVNDTCGHIAGDELLNQLSGLLRSKIREGDALARLGGDEFGLLLRYCSLDKAIEIAEALRGSVEDYRFFWKSRVFDVGISIGLVSISVDSGTLTDVLSAADSACYVAKDLGRNRVHVYQPDDLALAQHKGQMEWVQTIRRALDEQRFCLFYQRIKSLTANGTDKAFEILLRMKDRYGHIILPGTFIPAAERYHLMPLLDRWVIATTFSQLSTYLHEHPDHICSINLSGQSLADDKLLPFILEHLGESSLAAKNVCFELTETAAISRLEWAMTFIESLKTAGCHFALDDFGSGLNSFTYLKQLPVDHVKIDGAFIRDILHDPVDHAMVETINHMVHVMGKKTVGEFVENDAILKNLRTLAVDFAQGNAIHEPMPIEHLTGNKKPARVSIH